MPSYESLQQINPHIQVLVLIAFLFTLRLEFCTIYFSIFKVLSTRAVVVAVLCHVCLTQWHEEADYIWLL